MPGELYLCDNCKCTFLDTRSRAERMAEMLATFKPIAGDRTIRICAVCYREALERLEGRGLLAKAAVQ